MLRRSLLLVALASLPGSFALAHDGGGKKGSRTTAPAKAEDDRVATPRAPRTLANGEKQPVIVYLNRDGVTLTGGWDDPARGVSSIVYGHGADEVRFPAFTQGNAVWRETVACVRDKFAPFDVRVVDERPAAGPYIMAVIGGRSTLLGYGDGVGGVAPYSGGVLQSAVVFTFEQTLYPGAQGACEVTTHEVGHALGLDHIHLCQDPMTYLQGCGEKTFQDQDAPCGEYEARTCGSGQETQNSYRQLAATVGLRAGATPPTTREPEREPAVEQPEDPTEDPTEQPEPEDPTDDAAEPEDDGGEDPDRDGDRGGSDDTGGWSDESGPDLTILSPDPGERYAANGTVTIAIHAWDEDGVARVELGWARGDSLSVFVCDDLPADIPVTCEQDGDDYRYTLRVGSGLRGFAVRVTDNQGNQSVSDTRALRFE